jgi:hypothetical protein
LPYLDANISCMEPNWVRPDLVDARGCGDVECLIRVLADPDDRVVAATFLRQLRAPEAVKPLSASSMPQMRTCGLARVDP